MSDDEIEERKDASRADFDRGEGEIGVYINIYEAKKHAPENVGSDQFLRMETMEKLYDNFINTDEGTFLSRLRTRKPFKGVYIERFEKGIIMVLGFDDTTSLESVWQMDHEKFRNAIQDVLLGTKNLADMGLANLTLNTRMFEDEYVHCKEDLIRRSTCSNRLIANDAETISKLRRYQLKFSDILHAEKERELGFEKSLGEFFLNIKSVLPAQTEILNTVKELKDFSQRAKVSGKKTPILDQFFDHLSTLEKIIDELEISVYHRLLTIHAQSETDQQKNLKNKILQELTNARQELCPEAHLQNLNHHEWSKKILKREQGLYRGLISIIPLINDRLMEISCNMDEYLASFPR